MGNGNHAIKDLNKLIKKILSTKKFIREYCIGKKSDSYKIINIRTKEFYLVHPGVGAIKPLKSWYLKQMKL